MFKHKELLETGAVIALSITFWTVIFMGLSYVFSFHDLDCLLCYEAVNLGLKCVYITVWFLMAFCVLTGLWEKR